MKEAYGKDFDGALKRLKPGVVSRPFASPYGYHIVKWQPIKDEELLPISRIDFVTSRTSKVLDQITASAKVEDYTQSR
jgi:parvulin-like peptidyl-prolyl isomerase